MRVFVFTLFLFFSQVLVFAKSKDTTKEITAIKITKDITIDGKLTESVYQKTPITGFVQRDPDEGKEESEKTHVWVSYDEANLYVSAKMYDSNPGEIDASLMRRDYIVESDWFFFFVDPYNDKRTGYFFAINAGGSISDGILYNDSWNDYSWDGIWQGETHIDETGWSMEMKIPISQLRFKEEEIMKWGVNFNRDIKRKKESDYFVMVPKTESGFVSHFAELNGLNGIKSQQRLEVLPYLVQKAQFLEHESSDPFYKGNQFNTSIGADFKLGLGSSITIDGTINPDFGQVEVDPAVVNLSAFETFFPEKRPFFIEGSNIFSFGYGGSNNNWGFNFGVPQLFYSRRIGRYPQGDNSDNDYADIPKETTILGAAKLTGKIGDNWTLGTLSAVSERTFAALDYNGIRSREEVEPLTHYGVLRSQKEFNNGKQAIGIIFTSVNRKLSDSNLNSHLAGNAFTFGLDGWTFLDDDETYIITANVIGSYTNGSKSAIEDLQKRPYRYLQRPDAEFARIDINRTSLAGWFTRVALNKQKGNFYINTSIGAVSPGFENNDLGFQWHGNKLNGHIVAGYRWYEPDKIFRRKSLYLSHFRDYNFDGDNTNNGIMLFSNWQFNNYYGIDLRASHNFSVYNDRWTRGGPIVKLPSETWLFLSAYSDSREKIIGNLYFNFGTDKNGTKIYDSGFDVQWKPSSQVDISIGPELSNRNEKRQWVDSYEDNTAIYTYGSRYLFAEIDQKTISGNVRLNWTFTPQLSLQLFLQPLFSVGAYNNFVQLAQAGTNQYNSFGEGNSTIEYSETEDEYIINPDLSSNAEIYTFSNPDFNFKSLRGNLVLRYEMLPGTILYLVWSHDRTNDENAGNFNFKRDLTNLWKAETNNIFLLKFSYWLNV
jgi:hypothetical protein